MNYPIQLICDVEEDHIYVHWPLL